MFICFFFNFNDWKFFSDLLFEMLNSVILRIIIFKKSFIFTSPLNIALASGINIEVLW